MKKHFNSTLRSTLRSTALSVTAVMTLANCSATKALDATQSMPDKIDATNGQVKETNAEVKKTNKGMETMIEEVKKTNAGMDTMVGEVKKTNGGMDTMVGEVKKTNAGMDTMVGEVRKTNDGMAKTNLAVHRQTLQAALGDILREDNTRFLAPPVAMMPGAQIFSLEASPDELMQLVYVFLNFVEKTPQNDQDKANPDSYNHAKIVRLTAASVIAGLAPQSTIDQIVQSQIVQAGAFQDAAIALLMLRAQFLQQWIIQPKIDQGLTNPGMIEDAVNYTDQLTAISTLPFADKIAIKITGLIGDDMAKDPDETGKRPTLNDRYTSTLNVKRTMLDWKKLNAAVDALDPKYTDEKSDTAKRVGDLKAKIQSRIQGLNKPDAPSVTNG